MPTADQISWLREDVGTNEGGLSDVEAEALFARAESISSEYAVQEPLTRIYYIRSLLASSAKLTTYRQNQTQENISDLFKHLSDMLDYWEDKLGEAYLIEAAAAYGSVRSGRASRLPTRYRELPNSG